MIITCPNCQTKYQLADNSIGSAGRKVQCANCHQPWQAVADLPPQREKPKLVRSRSQDLAGAQDLARSGQLAKDGAGDQKPDDGDKLFDADAEAELDRAFAAAETEMSDSEKSADGSSFRSEPPRPEPPLPEPPRRETGRPERSAMGAKTTKPMPAVGADDADDADDADAGEPVADEEQQSRLEALYRRQRKLASQSPLAKMRRVVRVFALIVLAAVLGGGLIFRMDIVRAFPDLGGLYAAIGLGVNIDGLKFTDVHTVRTLRDGVDVMVISAKIENVSNVSHDVPPVLVSILDGAGLPMYQWKARAKGDVVGIGEAVGFETQLSSAPLNAQKVHLVFAREKLNKSGMAHR